MSICVLAGGGSSSSDETHSLILLLRNYLNKNLFIFIVYIYGSCT